MIISVSRRTDIPAFYSDWFFNRLKDGRVYVINPMNTKQISSIKLDKNSVDCFVFWTKNPKPMISRLGELEGYDYYFQFTITPYGSEVEKNIYDKKEIVKTFKELSEKIGAERVILRYDPIFLSRKYTIDYHVRAFEKLLSELHNYTKTCVISFIDIYRKTARNTKDLNLVEMKDSDIYEIAEKFSSIALKYGIEMQTCSEGYDLSRYGINKGKCIDDKLISKITGFRINAKKDDTQREVCGCVKSIDIGQYNTCLHHCLYCYANYNFEMVKDNCKHHKKDGMMLVGEPSFDAKITEREMKSVKGKIISEVKTEQTSLF